MQRTSVNKVIIVGHIGNKPEGRYTPSGTSTASFSIATNETWFDSDKEKKEKTEWHNIITWNKLADFTTEYLQKGQLVYVEGRLQSRTYKDKDEVQHRVTEVIAITITPLEWKTSPKQNNGLIEKPSPEKVAEPRGEEDLPF